MSRVRSDVDATSPVCFEIVKPLRPSLQQRKRWSGKRMADFVLFMLLAGAGLTCKLATMTVANAANLAPSDLGAIGMSGIEELPG